MLPALAAAQPPALSRADSGLILRILTAEDRRDSTDTALAEGVRHADERIRRLAQRARWRIGDGRFAARDSLPALPSPPLWAEPAWRLRYRALTPKSDCAEVRSALTDSVWAVRLHAADLVTPACTGDEQIAIALRSWIDELPKNTSRRSRDGVSWHGAAHAIVALARLRKEDARARATALSRNRQWELRMYATRALADLADTVRLRALAGDADANVKEAAITALSKLVGHDGDDLYVAALESPDAQAARAAALALKGSKRADVHAAANQAFTQWAKRNVSSARDVRVALLEAAGRPDTDDQPPVQTHTLPRDVVRLALGQSVLLRVVMSPASGGGTFMVRLRGDVAPIMAARILSLARQHYNDGGHWHRVEADFVIQGAGPGTNEYVGYEQYFRDELGNVPHVRGTVGMSTRSHDTGDAQWFINLRDNLRLNRDYTVFAEIVDGIDVVDGILEGDVVQRISEVRRGR